MATATKGFAASRRTFLKGMGLGALALGMGAPAGARLVRAQSAPGQVSALYRFPVGDFQITAIQDGLGGFPPDFFAANAEAGSVGALLEENNLPVPEVLLASINVLLAQAGDRTILLDTGYGNITLDPNAPPSGGRLLATLELIGVAAEDVTDVLISHFHPDHIGAVSDMATPIFPNAAYHFPQAEYDFLNSGVSTGNEQVDGIIQLANGIFAPVSASDQLQLFDGEAEPIPGVQIIPAPGHSPGHVAVMLNSNGSRLLNVMDSAIHYLASLANPQWHFGFDAVPDLAVESRLMILNMAADEQIPVLGYHFPFPGVGVIDRDGEGFRFVPTV